MGALSGLGAASPSIKDPFFLVGDYTVQITEVKLHDSTKTNDMMFIIRAKVLRSNVAARGVGVVCAQVIKVTGNKSALGNIKAFVAACVGAGVDDAEAMAEINEKFLEDALKDKIFVGMVLDLTCSETLTQKNTTFTIHNWRQPAAKTS